MLSSSKSQDGWTSKGPFFVEELVEIMLDFSCQKLHFFGGVEFSVCFLLSVVCNRTVEELGSK